MVIPNTAAHSVNDDPLKTVIIVYGPFGIARFGVRRHDRARKIQVSLDDFQPGFLHVCGLLHVFWHHALVTTCASYAPPHHVYKTFFTCVFIAP
jgi:hypothetical protein